VILMVLIVAVSIIYVSATDYYQPPWITMKAGLAPLVG